MAADVNTGMPKVAMKQFLARSKEDPVNCAIAQGDNAQLGLLFMHRSKSGIACQKQLLDDFPHAKNARWGTAFVDVDDNPKLVKFTLNKPVSGMARKLVNTLKGTGYTKVVIVLEDGSAVETVDDEAAPEVAAAAAPPPPPPPAPPPPQAQPTAEDRAATLAALTKRLATLAPLIPKAAGEDAGRRAVLLKMAGEANTNIKTGNLVYAATSLDGLERELNATPAPGTNGAAAPTTTQTFANSRIAWAGTRQRVQADIERLRTTLATTYAGQPFATQIDTSFRTTVAPVLQTFDDRLLTLLDRMATAAETETAPLISEARATMKSYLAYAMSEPLIADLDNNPFAPLTIRTTVTTTLAALAKALH